MKLVKSVYDFKEGDYLLKIIGKGGTRYFFEVDTYKNSYNKISLKGYLFFELGLSKDRKYLLGRIKELKQFGLAFLKKERNIVDFFEFDNYLKYESTKQHITYYLLNKKEVKLIKNIIMLHLL